MLRKTMIALCAVASIGMLVPDMALARGGVGGGGHGGGGGGGGGRGGGLGGGSFGARGFSGGNFSNSFAHAAPNGNFGAVQGNRFASSSRIGRGFDRDHDHDRGFRRNRGFFVGDDFFAGDYWDYPNYAYDDSYYDNGNCYVVQRRVHTSYGWRVRPVQVCG